MKKIVLFYFALFFFSVSVFAADTLMDVMPLLQAPVRSEAQTQQILQLFSQTQQPDLIFSTGASLVRIPPAQNQENRLINILVKNNHPLKQVFAAVILTAMGTEHTELSDLLQEATASADPAVRAYAASAYTILNPQVTQYSNEIVHLYIYDPAFAQRAMNLISSNASQTLRYLKTAAQSEPAQLRAAAAAWLGDMQNPSAAKQLLKMAKTETDSEVMPIIAQGLAKNQQWTLSKTIKGLKTDYTTSPAITYALALGFMTGNAVEPIKQALLDKNINKRINAARAAAYMAGVLASSEAFLYTNDRAFDVQLLKSLIPLLSAVAQSGNEQEKIFAQNALTQIAQLK